MKIHYSIEMTKEEIAELMASLTTMIQVLLREIERPPQSFDPPENLNRDIG